MTMRYTTSIATLGWFLATCPPFSTAVKTRLTWVNGIGYSLEHMEEGKRELAKIFAQKIEYCHNPTSMKNDDDLVGYLGDLSQAGTQKLGKVTEEVNLLVQHLKDAVASVGSKGQVVHIAHSQGALVTHLASRRLTPHEMSKIEVLSFGGAAALQRTAATPFKRCVNYYSTNDPLLLLVPEAVQALRSGFVGNEEFCFLAPREGDPIADHSLLGLTYSQALAWEGLRFQRKYKGVIYRGSRSILMTLVMFCKLFHTKLIQILKAMVRPLRPYLVLFWMVARDKFAPILNFLKTKVLPPILLLILVFADWFYDIISSLTGNEQYVPADNILNKSKQ